MSNERGLDIGIYIDRAMSQGVKLETSGLTWDQIDTAYTLYQSWDKAIASVTPASFRGLRPGGIVEAPETRSVFKVEIQPRVSYSQDTAVVWLTPQAPDFVVNERMKYRVIASGVPAMLKVYSSKYSRVISVASADLRLTIVSDQNGQANRLGQPYLGGAFLDNRAEVYNRVFEQLQKLTSKSR